MAGIRRSRYTEVAIESPEPVTTPQTFLKGHTKSQQDTADKRGTGMAARPQASDSPV